MQAEALGSFGHCENGLSFREAENWGVWVWVVLRGLWSGQPKALGPKSQRKYHVRSVCRFKASVLDNKRLSSLVEEQKSAQRLAFDPGLQKDIAGRIDQKLKELI